MVDEVNQPIPYPVWSGGHQTVTLKDASHLKDANSYGVDVVALNVEMEYLGDVVVNEWKKLLLFLGGKVGTSRGNGGVLVSLDNLPREGHHSTTSPKQTTTIGECTSPSDIGKRINGKVCHQEVAGRERAGARWRERDDGKCVWLVKGDERSAGRRKQAQSRGARQTSRVASVMIP
ncbi:hypothetical protein GUJ93_ZPchr0009g2212 [Zizania palustris]|uniref:Uncharacterized protein n=1 Tax=Zizania palustris TaxID=103762 RepID=A0A8J5UXL2_ZIZPA|nr:hypothetical protein GUJ93_ZPchr0009g2212 [Zizania palustris]